MERFTCRDSDGTTGIFLDESSEWTVARNANRQYTITGDAIDRLAAYEDTGLEPEEIYEVRFLIAAQRDPNKLARLRDLVLADQAGKLVVLPCKVGDTVYVIGESCDFCETYLDEPERCMRCEKGHYVEERGFELWMLSELNESIFLTRDEAEAALAGKGDANEADPV